MAKQKTKKTTAKIIASAKTAGKYQLVSTLLTSELAATMKRHPQYVSGYDDLKSHDGIVRAATNFMNRMADDLAAAKKPSILLTIPPTAVIAIATACEGLVRSCASTLRNVSFRRG